MPRQCRVYTAVFPAAQWGWDEILANKTNYLLELLVWMKTKDAQKKTPRHKPKPYMPDFMKPPTKPSPINNGAEAHESTTVEDILKQPRG